MNSFAEYPALTIIVIDNWSDIIILMNGDQPHFDNIWEVVLSRNPKRILLAFESLQPDQKKAVREHLYKMVSEPGWQPEQRKSAQAALDAIPDQ